MSKGVAIVTGGASGIGAAISRRMLSDGYEVISLALRKPDWSDDKLHAVEVDLTDEQATQARPRPMSPRALP